MTVIQYPVFVEGQTLTDDDLNDLRDALDQVDRRIGRSIGFGIDCGLGGSIAGTTLRIGPGLAIDQLGQVLELDDELTIALAPTASSDAAPGFIDPLPGGFTPVLAMAATDVPAVACNEVGCEAHAKQRQLTTSVSVFAGRLRDAIVDFGDEKLLEHEPLLVRKTSTVAGGFVTLRNAIVDRIGDRLDPDARVKLASMTIDGDLPAIQAYKAGFLNQVFFAALDLLRCELEMSATCVTADDGIGIALGWLHQNGAGWSWDCRYRHDWDIPVGVAMALLGGRCADPCDLYRDELNALINAFEVPVVPAPEDDPDPQPPDLCWELPHRYTYPYTKLVRGCDVVQVPPHTLDPDRFRKYFREKVPIPPIPPEERAGEIYGLPPTDWAQAGTLILTEAIGKRTDNVVKEITDVLSEKGNESPVQVYTRNQIADIEGYVPGVAVSGADTVVLVEDAHHKVIGLGSVPANTTMRNAVVELPRVAGLAERADVAAKDALETAGVLTNRLVSIDDQLKGFDTFEHDVLAWQTTVNDRMSGLSNEIDVKASAVIGTYQLAVLGQVDERMGAGLKTLREDVQLDQEALEAKIGDLDEQVAGLAGQVSVAVRDAERSMTRIDQVLSGGRDRGPVRDVIDRDLVAVIGNMRSSILAAATRAQRDRVTEELAKSAEAFKAVSDAASAAPVSFEPHREALGSILTSMTIAVEAAGAPAADVERLRRGLGGLINR